MIRLTRLLLVTSILAACDPSSLEPLASDTQPLDNIDCEEGEDCQDDSQGPDLDGHSLPNGIYFKQGSKWKLVKGPIFSTWLEVKTDFKSTPNGLIGETDATADAIGHTFAAGNIKVRIVGAAPVANGVARYLVKDITASSSGVDLCAGGQPAYAVPEALHANGSLNSNDSNGFSLVCEGSAAAKAIKWGYRPWKVTGQAKTGKHNFFAATMLARADYCATGQSNTLLGTQVVLTSGLGPLPSFSDTEGDGSEDGLHLEAVWRGVDNVDVDGYGPWMSPVVCLSKLRWQALKPGGPCPEQSKPLFGDPRQNTNDDVGGVPDHKHFCEDMAAYDPQNPGPWMAAMRAQHGALIFSFSRFNERGLWLWQSSNQYLATTDGRWDGNDAGLAGAPPGFGFPDGQGAPTWIAAVHRYQAANTVPLHLYTRVVAGIAEYVTGLQPPAGGGWSSQVIGWVYESPGLVPAELSSHIVALRSWTKVVHIGGVPHTVTKLLPGTTPKPLGFTGGAIIAYGFQR